MEYSEQLGILSKAILQFDKTPTDEFFQLVSPHSFNRLKVYRKNLFYGAYRVLSDSFVGLNRHLEKDNFRFLVRRYLLTKGIQSADIAEFSTSFAPFLKQMHDYCQDPLLESIAKLDLLYMNGNVDKKSVCRVPQGVFKYWSDLISNRDEIDINIDLNSQEQVKSLEIDGERSLFKETS